MSPTTFLDLESAEPVFHAGETGPLWRLQQGLVRLDRLHGSARQAVQLALPGDLIGIEALCGQSYQFSAVAFLPSRLQRVAVDGRGAAMVGVVSLVGLFSITAATRFTSTRSPRGVTVVDLVVLDLAVLGGRSLGVVGESQVLPARTRLC